MKRVFLVLVTLSVLALTASMALAECGADHSKQAGSGTTKTGS